MGDPLVHQLRQCCLRVMGNSPGCGFFIAPRLVITCAHVVGRDVPVGTEIAHCHRNFHNLGKPTAIPSPLIPLGADDFHGLHNLHEGGFSAELGDGWFELR
jgi:hypothetical protein